MTSEAIVSIPLSRPKIHRLPARSIHSGTYLQELAYFLRRHISARPLLLTCGAMLAMVVLVILLNSFVSLAVYHIGALPRVSADHVDSDAISDEGSQISFGDAMASTLPPEKSSKLIVITGDAGTIVGQMTKIPDQNGQVTEIKAMSGVDKDTGRELLSIVGKY